MAKYPAGWRWTNGLAQEKARMLLPLAWLVRVSDTPANRAVLRKVAADVIALLGLHEAACATGEKDILQACDKLAEFLCRIQIQSRDHPYLDGGWFRAFDYARWEHWGPNADAGWGAWCIESGWTQGWIVSVLAMRQMDTSLWDLTRDSKIKRHFERLRRKMLPDEVLDPLKTGGGRR